MTPRFLQNQARRLVLAASRNTGALARIPAAPVRPLTPPTVCALTHPNVARAETAGRAVTGPAIADAPEPGTARPYHAAASQASPDGSGR
jgi:hypothetical protein